MRSRLPAWFACSALLSGSIAGLVHCGSSGSSGGPSDASSPSSENEDPIDPTSKCYFTGRFSGGMTGGLRASGCGEGYTLKDGFTNFGMDRIDLMLGRIVSVQFYLATPIPAGVTGHHEVKSLKLYETVNKVESRWESTTCSIDVEKNDATPLPYDAGPDGGAAAHVDITGKGSCPDPAAPINGNTKAPVTISPFQFHFVDDMRP
jgi:hypothetical protein